MSRIASVKETGEDISQADWKRFEQAVGIDGSRPSDNATRAKAVPADESAGSDERETANPRPAQA